MEMLCFPTVCIASPEVSPSSYAYAAPHPVVCGLSYIHLAAGKSSFTTYLCNRSYKKKTPCLAEMARQSAVCLERAVFSVPTWLRGGVRMHSIVLAPFAFGGPCHAVPYMAALTDVACHHLPTDSLSAIIALPGMMGVRLIGRRCRIPMWMRIIARGVAVAPADQAHDTNAQEKA